jgi:hypothetical protein
MFRTFFHQLETLSRAAAEGSRSLGSATVNNPPKLYASTEGSFSQFPGNTTMPNHSRTKATLLFSLK